MMAFAPLATGVAFLADVPFAFASGLLCFFTELRKARGGVARRALAKMKYFQHDAYRCPSKSTADGQPSCVACKRYRRRDARKRRRAETFVLRIVHTPLATTRGTTGEPAIVYTLRGSEKATRPAAQPNSSNVDERIHETEEGDRRWSKLCAAHVIVQSAIWLYFRAVTSNPRFSETGYRYSMVRACILPAVRTIIARLCGSGARLTRRTDTAAKQHTSQILFSSEFQTIHGSGRCLKCGV